MKHIYLKYFIFIFITSILSSCSDEFLTETNPTLIAKDNYWRDLSETQKGLNAAYQVLNREDCLLIVEEAQRSDMAWPAYRRPIPGTYSEFYDQTYNNSTSKINTKWEANYSGIFRANQVIEGLNGLEGSVDEAEWTSQMAQARFLRGLFHYYLYATYNNGNIIIRSKIPVTNEELNPPLSSAEEVITFIREDLEFAYQNLYAKGEYSGVNNPNIASSGAAATVLGNGYLQEKNYTKAMEYFSDVINNHDYQLEYDMELLFTTAGENNKESIFEINVSNTLKPEVTTWNSLQLSSKLAQYTTGVVGALAPAWLVYEYKNEQKDPLDDRNYYIDEINGRSFRNVPLRCSAKMAVIEDEQTLYYLDGSVTENMKTNAINWGVGWHKVFSNHDIVEAESDMPYGSIRSGKNITVNRLAEVMLNQAECLIQTGNVEGAISLINEIRKRWGLILLGLPNGDTSHTYDLEVYTAEKLMEHLMFVEKPLEMSIEGHAIRFLDLKRWGMVKENFKRLSESTFYTVSYFYTLPENPTKQLSKWSSSVITDEELNGATPNFTIDFEYDNAFSNYNESLHSTFPIPLSEINANYNIN